MTDIDKLEGRELDKVVADAMGQVPCELWMPSTHGSMATAMQRMPHPDELDGHDCLEMGPPHYHRSFDACAPLLEEMRDGIDLRGDPKVWDVWQWVEGDERHLACSESLPIAICRAYLRFKESHDKARADD